MTYGLFVDLVDRLDTDLATLGPVLAWCPPVPCFGNARTAKVATLGLNPSSREFLDQSGGELTGPLRRFPTLRSLGVASWSELDSDHVRAMTDACASYFDRNPYWRWFSVLERLLAKVPASLRGDRRSACHLDLFPYATSERWGDLDSRLQSDLIARGADGLGRVVQDSGINLLVLNGQAVIKGFQSISSVSFLTTVMAGWELPRAASTPVPGIAYVGDTETIGGVHLGRRLRVVGFNHNLQSSFGVTNEVVMRISEWLRDQFNSVTRDADR